MRFATACLILTALALSACGRMSHTPEDAASWFFDRGEHWIVDALEEQDASDDQIAAAEAVLAQHRAPVTASLTVFFEQHRKMFVGLASGSDAAALVAIEEPLHSAHVASLEHIGAMHEEIGNAVGPETWRAATAYMNERMSRRMHE